MNRNDVTEKIITVKVAKGIQWADVAKKVGQSKEWTTAACLGQMTLDAAQAKIVGKIFGLTAEEQKWLQVVPYKGSLPTAGADRSADLPLVRDRERLRHHHQGTDPRGVRRRHHERDRLQHGHPARRPTPRATA